MYHDVGAAVGGGFNQVFCRHNRQVRDFSQLLYRQLLIAIRGVQTRTDGGGAQVHFQQQLGGAQQVFGLFVQQYVKRVEFLAERHRHRVLQLGTTHFQDVLELNRFTLEAITQLVDRVHQFHYRGIHRDTEAGRVGVVGGLAFVNVVVRVQVLVFTFLVTHQLQANVCQYFVSVHVDGGARAALIDVNRELVHAFAVVQHFIAGRDNRICRAFRNGLQLFVGQCCGFLHHHHATDKLRDVADFAVADVEVFNRSQSVDTVVGIRWNFPGTQQVFFDTNVV